MRHLLRKAGVWQMKKAVTMAARRPWLPSPRLTSRLPRPPPDDAEDADRSVAERCTARCIPTCASPSPTPGIAYTSSE